MLSLKGCSIELYLADQATTTNAGATHRAKSRAIRHQPINFVFVSKLGVLGSRFLVFYSNLCVENVRFSVSMKKFGVQLTCSLFGPTPM
jgi:hypothetical protein